MSAPVPRYERGSSELDRAIGFVDATFAVALTLLVTGLEIGENPQVWTSLSALNDEVGLQFVAFVISFAVISSYWLEHHRMVASFAAIDRPVIIANLFLVAAIVILPFSTKSVGDPGVENLPLPSAVLAVNVAAASALQTLVYVMACRRRLLASEPSRAEFVAQVATSLTPAGVFLFSIPIAYLVDPGAAQLVWVSLFVLNPTVARWLRGTRRQHVPPPTDAGERG